MSKVKKTNSLNKNEGGFTLVGVLMVLVVLSVLGMSIITVTSNSMKLSAGERDNQSVFYIAEAAMTVEMDFIEKKVKEIYNTTKKESDFYNELKLSIQTTTKDSTATFEESFGKKPGAKIKVEEMTKNNPRLYKVTSTGTINNKKRVVERDFLVEWIPKNGEFGNMAVFVKEKIELNGKITGNIGTSQKKSGSILVGNDVEYGDKVFKGIIYVPVGYAENAVTKVRDNLIFNTTIQSMNESPEIKLPLFPRLPTTFNSNWKSKFTKTGNNGTLVLDDNFYIPQLISKELLPGGGILTIDIGTSNRELLLDELIVDGDRKVVINGSGKLKIFVTTNIGVTGGGVLNGQFPNGNSIDVANVTNLQINKLEVYSKGTSFKVTGRGRMYGSVYIENGNVDISGSGIIHGNIFSGGSTVDVKGGETSAYSTILAPNANVNVSGSGIVNGVIYGRNTEVYGGGEIRYRSPLLMEGAFAYEFGSAGTAKFLKKVLIEK